MKIGILNPSPLGPNLIRWGDYPFGRSLESALTRLGVEVEQRFWPEWDQLGDVDVCLTLRGKRSHTPKPGQVNAMWIISHPASVSASEMDAYDIVFTASETHKQLIGTSVGCLVHVLRQCTDTSLFTTTRSVEDDMRARRGALFVANSRNVRRPIVSRLLEAGFPFEIIGRHWREVGLGDAVRSAFVENRDLPAVYSDCRLALNDHWVDMKHFGFVNNRIFDCLATGTPILTDSFLELKEICGEALLYSDDARSSRQSLRDYYFDYPRVLGNVRKLWSRIGAEYTFDRRAAQLTALLGSFVPRSRPERLAAQDHPRTRQVLRTIDALKAKLGRTELQVLHVAPHRGLQHVLAGRGDIDYITAGFGTGPWLVDMSEGWSVLPPGRFHFVILEGSVRRGPEIDVLVAEGGEMTVLLDEGVSPAEARRQAEPAAPSAP